MENNIVQFRYIIGEPLIFGGFKSQIERDNYQKFIERLKKTYTYRVDTNYSHCTRRANSLIFYSNDEQLKNDMAAFCCPNNKMGEDPNPNSISKI